MLLVLNWITIGWAALLLSSIVTIMAVFMGSSSQDLAGFLFVQTAMVPLALLATAGYIAHASRHSGDASALRTLWSHIPGWLVFIALSAASLTLISELTFALIDMHAEVSRPWHERVPAISAVASAVALAAGYANLKIIETR